ncbi:hypothetical protein TBLA_0D03710 [Henningerozyma blattae CBS 6284]|uniref:Uncharacterized protein n=1 Tax=Henningerozyma blattae (strain ATCC 34711 / CBS 6284 / DSM 70876 / NBRC 10599 / NRRL Y-10934 / UCD 77-7) TaxID=1071380 RepID=I2H3B8_HENB6|nr:hypothetical protein TBLA_0D03710 [Tetrapisispora blattae CBS 6284]CCH60870.1 hypothetical protein TBLA_0D03710 [Tetrapisispora blattae CBS 6284]
MIFDEGYNRKDIDLEEFCFTPKRLNTNPTFLFKPIALKDANKRDEAGNIQHSTKQESIKELKVQKTKNTKTKPPKKISQEPLSISEVYDPKNQLSSLVRNAKRNQEALQLRNKRISKNKFESKKRYGW